MRPWTIVVLSEHGRDRWAFRDSERLFSPSLDRLALPVIQSVRSPDSSDVVPCGLDCAKGGPWRTRPLLSPPREHFDSVATQVVRDLIDQPEMRVQLTKDLADWIRFSPGGLRVADADRLAQDLLWKPPRAVLRQVVPSLWNAPGRRWHRLRRYGRQRLLPQFLPERTWEVLDTQDVELAMPKRRAPLMDVRRALHECVPGRVSRRYAVGRTEPSKWLAWSAQLLNAAPPTIAAPDLFFAEFTLTTICQM